APPLFPYTTLFRSLDQHADLRVRVRVRRRVAAGVELHNGQRRPLALDHAAGDPVPDSQGRRRPDVPERAHRADRSRFATVRSRARVVVIGGGVGGCSILYWLTRLGWSDVVLVERPELTSAP